MKTRHYDERLGWHEHIHIGVSAHACACGHNHIYEDEAGGDAGCRTCECRWWHRNDHMSEYLLVTEGQIAQADHRVRCEPIATAEQWCFHKHIEYANDLVRSLRSDPDGLKNAQAVLDSLELQEGL